LKVKNSKNTQSPFLNQTKIPFTLTFLFASSRFFKPQPEFLAPIFRRAKLPTDALNERGGDFDFVPDQVSQNY
jgi:hypothetical protein